MKLYTYFLLFICCICLLSDAKEYITSIGFKKMAKYEVRSTQVDFDPRNIEPKSIVYVDRVYLNYFFEKVFPEIVSPFILVTHNADPSAPGEFFEYLNDKRILRWYGENCDIKNHPKFFPLPIGISNRSDAKVLDIVLAEMDVCDQTEKIHKLYMNFSLDTDKLADHDFLRRVQVYEHFIHEPFVFHAKRKPFKEYLLEMSQYLFVLSPFGGGLDCYRTWEALLMGSIPVVHSSTLNDLYKDLPIIVVEDWDEVTEDFLERKYLEIKDLPYNKEKIFMQYWVETINLYRNSLPLFLEKAKFDFLVNDQFLIHYVKECIKKANEQRSKLTRGVLSIEGTFSAKVKHFLNNVCSLDGMQYLEIGVYKGSTFIAALYKNNDLVDPIAIDNWAEFAVREAFKKNTDAFLPKNIFRVVDHEAFSIDIDKIFYRPVNVYFYDGHHSYESHYKAFTHYDKIFADTFIAIVDDWNLDQVRNGTRDAFKALNYIILFEEALPARYDGDKENWWNGLYVAVIKKPTKNKY